MAVKTRWRVSRKAGPVRLRVRGGLRGGETRLDGWRVAAWYQGRADRRRPGLRGQEALAAGSERANTTNSPLQPATTKRMRVDRELAGAGSRGLAKEPDKVRLSARRRYGAKVGAPRRGSSVSGLPLDLLDALSLSGRAGNRAPGRDGGVWTAHRSLDGGIENGGRASHKVSSDAQQTVVFLVVVWRVGCQRRESRSKGTAGRAEDDERSGGISSSGLRPLTCPMAEQDQGWPYS